MTHLAPGQMLVGKYRIGQSLGEGGMGAVFLAENVDLGRQVAIKVLLPQAADNPEMVARFRQEARAAAAIGHPGIVDVLDLGRTEEGAQFIVMEHLRGEDLGDRLKRDGPLPLPVVLEILGHLLDALEAAHRHDIVHRDLKPDNIFLVSEPISTVKILDFGISKLAGQHEPAVRTASGAVMGTPLYMSPEQALAERDIGPTTDLYSLGAILYQMLTGKPPFATDNTARLMLMITSEMPAPVTTLRGELPEGLGSLVMELLRKEPAERPQSATEIKQRLASVGLPRSICAGDETLAPLATDETLAPRSAITGPGVPAQRDEVALAPTESQPGVTGPGSAAGTGDTRLAPPTRRTALWVGAGLVLAALVAYPVIRTLGEDPEPAPASAPATPDRAPPAPDARVIPDTRPAFDLPLPDARTRPTRPRPGRTKRLPPRQPKPGKIEKPPARTPPARKPPGRKPPGGLGLPPPSQDDEAVKGSR